MTKKELRIVWNALRHAQTTIEEVACDNYPWEPFNDSDLRDMFYELNEMCLKLHEKMETAE